MSVLASLQPDMLKLFLRDPNANYEVVEPVLPCTVFVENEKT